MPTPVVGEDLAAFSGEKVFGNERALNPYVFSRVEEGFLRSFRSVG